MPRNCEFFFFSSRRRHTRWPRDWSSDVCSSDLKYAQLVAGVGDADSWATDAHKWLNVPYRSEERRVGKECRCRRAPAAYTKKRNERYTSAMHVTNDRKQSTDSVFCECLRCHKYV